MNHFCTASAKIPTPLDMELGRGVTPGDLHVWFHFPFLWGRLAPPPAAPEGRGDLLRTAQASTSWLGTWEAASAPHEPESPGGRDLEI